MRGATNIISYAQRPTAAQYANNIASSSTIRGSSDGISFVLFIVIVSCFLLSLVGSPVVVQGAQLGCWACCPYACNGTCYSCECFTATANNSDVWQNCSNKSLYVNLGASGEIVNNYQVSLQYNGDSAVGRISGNAGVGSVRVLGSSTATYAYGSITTFVGNGYGGTGVFVYSPATIGNLYGIVSGTISVEAGAGIENATMSSTNVTVSGYVTHIYPTASNVYVYGSSSSISGTGSTIFVSGSATTASITSGTVYVSGNLTNLYPTATNVYVQSGGSANLISGYGSVISVAGTVNLLCVTSSSTVTVTGTVTTLSIEGGATPVSVSGTVGTIEVGTSGNTFTFNGGSFSSMTLTAWQDSRTNITASNSTLGCIVFASFVANVPMIFTGSSFSRACHFIEFQNTVTSSAVVVQGGCVHNIPGYSAVYGFATFSNFLLRWDASQLTTTGSSNAFYLLAASDVTISVTNCSGERQLLTGGNGLAVLSGTQITFLVVSSTIASSGETFQCGTATTVTVSSVLSSLLANSTNVLFSGRVTSLYVYAEGSEFTAASGSNVYVSTSMASSTVTCYSSTFSAPAGSGVYVGGEMTSSSVTVTAASAWTSGVHGVYAGPVSSVYLLIVQSSSWTTGSSGFVVAGAVSTLGITVMSASTWTHGALGLTVVGAATSISVLVQANSEISSTSENVVLAGSTSVNITVTSTGAGDPARITSTTASNFILSGASVNVGVYLTGAGALISSPERNLYVTGTSASNVGMRVTSAATMTAGSNNWEFGAPLLGTSNYFLLDGQSLVRAQTNNFLLSSTGSLWLSVLGSSTLTAVGNNNLEVRGDSGMLRVVLTSSTVTAAVSNIVVGGSVLTDLTPNYVYMTAATLSAGSTGMEFSTTLGGQNILTITASASTTWSVGGIGAIYLHGYAVSSAITLTSSTLSVSTTSGHAAVVQLRSGTAQTMSSQHITMYAVLYTYTQAAGAVATTYASFVRSMDTNMVNSTITVQNCNFDAVAPLTHRMEILDLQGVTKLAGTTILLAKIPYTSNTLSCSTLPKGYPACDALMRGAILQAGVAGSVASCSITVQCIEFSTTTLSFMDFYGAVSDTFFRSDSVAIWQSQAIVSFLALNQAVGSSSNVVWILFTYLHVPIIVHSENGAASITSIASNCSFLSVHPMAEGFFEPALVPLVVRPQLWMCNKTYHSSCWITKSFSLSAMVSLSLSSEIARSVSPTHSASLLPPPTGTKTVAHRGANRASRTGSDTPSSTRSEVNAGESRSPSTTGTKTVAHRGANRASQTGSDAPSPEASRTRSEVNAGESSSRSRSVTISTRRTQVLRRNATPTLTSWSAKASETDDEGASGTKPQTTASLTQTASQLRTPPGFFSGDVFSSVFQTLLVSSIGNFTVLKVIERQVGSVRTENAFLLAPKIKALLSDSGGMSLTLRLVPELRARYELIGQRIAVLGAGELDVRVLNQTDISIFMKASGSQYLTSTSTVVIPLRSLLDGTVNIVGSQTMVIQVILTATTVTALETTKSVAAISGPLSVIASTPASAMAVTRLSILFDILQCGLGGDDDDSANNLLRIYVGPASGSSLRGAGVGNLAIVAALAVLFGLMFVAVILHGHCVHSAPPAAMLQDLLDIFHFPGILMLPIAAVAQPTLTATVQLIALTPVDGDVLFGVLGAAVLVLPLMMPYTIVIKTQFCLTLAEAGEHPKEILRADSMIITSVAAAAEVQPPSMPRRALHVLFGERKTWQPLDPTRVDQVAWKKRFAPVFIDCSTWWYPLADMWMSAFVGVAGGLTLGNQSICFFQLAVVTLSYAFIATLQMIVAPPLVFASRCYVMALQVLGLISCGAVLAAAVTDENNANSLSVSIASMCMLIVAVITTVKVCLDIVFILLAIPGRLRRAAGVGALHRRRHAGTADPGESVLVDVALDSLLLRGDLFMTQENVGSLELHYCGIEDAAVSLAEIPINESVHPALDLDMAAAAKPHERHHHHKKHLHNSSRLLGAMESPPSARGESSTLIDRRSLQPQEANRFSTAITSMRRCGSAGAVLSFASDNNSKHHQPTHVVESSPPLRRGASVRNLRPAPFAETSAGPGLDVGDFDRIPLNALLGGKRSSMRGLMSPTHIREGGGGEPLRKDASFREGVMDEQDRLHLARRAAMMLRVDDRAPSRVTDGNSHVDVGDLRQHYRAIERISSFTSPAKHGNEKM
jgi:hypothetical protein